MRNNCLNQIFNLSKKNNKIVFIGSDLGAGVMNEFKKKFPERFFMEGISEQAIIGFAAGLAKEGFLPFVNTISTFLTRRCFEQIFMDLCLHNLPVKLVGNGGGLVYAPLGPSHIAVDDISIMRTLPNMTIIAPSDKLEMINLVKESIPLKSPIYIRIARGGEPDINQEVKNFKIGKGILKIKPGKLLLISTGTMTHEAIKAANIINSKYKKNKIGVLHLGTVKPLDVSILKKWMPKVDKIITLEENYLAGGFGSSILEFCNDNFPEISNKISRIGIKEKFISQYGNHRELMELNNLTFSSIVRYINQKYL